MAKILETERMILRELSPDDADFILVLLNTPTWLQFIGDRNVKNVEQARKYIAEGPLRSYRENGFGLSLVELKESDIPIGVCGLLKRDGLEYPDLGFAFLPQYTKKGYAFEVASATIAFACANLRISTILAVTTPDNERSIRLLSKIGFAFENMVTLPDKHEEMMLHKFRREGQNPP